MTPAKTKTEPVEATPPVEFVETSNLLEAMCRVQAEAITLPKDKTATIPTGSGGSYSYSYTDLADIVKQVGPLLAKYGLAWMTFPGNDEHTGMPVLDYELAHAKSGDSRKGRVGLMLSSAKRGEEPGVRDLGSAITYMRRYTFVSVLNLVAEDDDDGAQAANSRAAGQGSGRSSGPSKAQREIIERLVAEKAFTRTELAARLPASVEVAAGWVDKLTPGKEGTASALIDWLLKLPKKSAQQQESSSATSDVPGADPGEFEHPPVNAAEDVPFDATPEPEEATSAA